MKKTAISAVVLGVALLSSSLLAAKQKEQKAADGKVPTAAKGFLSGAPLACRTPPAVPRTMIAAAATAGGRKSRTPISVTRAAF